MSEVTEAAVMEALRSVRDPSVRRDLVSLGVVKAVRIDDSRVTVELGLSMPGGARRQIIEDQCRQVVGQLPGIDTVEVHVSAPTTVKLTAGRPGPSGSVTARDHAESQQRSPQQGPPQQGRPQQGQAPPNPARPPALERREVAGIRNIIGIASGKGGVGKSTVAVNLACALAQTGARVGLLDADIYGPSIPMMMDAFEELYADSESRKMLPMERYDVKLMSIAFMNPGGDPIIWRGPIVSRALQQLIQEVQWGELDYLLVDLPPGTGDAPLTLAQVVPLSGVVIVMTPQDVATNIAAKSLAMFQRPPFEVPILGIIENMSTFVCPHCGNETEVFGHKRGSSVADDFGVRFLGSFPLNPAVAESGDAGKPIVVSAPDSPHGQLFRKIAQDLSERLGVIAKSQDEKKSGVFMGLERLFQPRRRPA